MGTFRKAAFLLTCLAAPALAQSDISGHYTTVQTVNGTEIYGKLELQQKGTTVTGKFMGDDLTGTRNGKTIDFVSKDKEGYGGTVHLVIQDGVLRGTAIGFDGTSHHTKYMTNALVARPVKTGAATAPKRHEFAPTAFPRAFSALNKPVLTIAPGDTVHTTTVDAGGTDEKAVSHALGGNPQTGPFYVEGVMPGDTVAIHIVKLRLNRDWATSDDYLVRNAVPPGLAVAMKDIGKTVHWHLDREKMTGTPENPGPHMTSYAVPLRPMLGCVAVASPPVIAAPNSGDSGFYGGNMDFNEITEGATVYLQARVPGALVYVGDGHAAMGDGELNGNGLETSMDVEFRVEVIRDKLTPQPRVETADRLMALGYEGSLDESLKTATFNMQRWLTGDYALDASEAALVIGSAATIRVSEAADRNSGVAIILDKSVLNTLKK
ncbi:MAG: acetamidase/formamidase family protein [Alphaproteobacteria bacterium]|nr:acetamidase/formamidase family protein [Alphaproteobacteria bacterium]